MGLMDYETMVVRKTTQEDLIQRVEIVMSKGSKWKPQGESYKQPWLLADGVVIDTYCQKMVRPRKFSSNWDWSM